jgi:hypothetical protein
MMTNERFSKPSQPDLARERPTLSAEALEEFRDLENLLDEALAPQAVAGGLPEGLADRIAAATQPRLKASRTVIGRIGPMRLGAALATFAALAAAVALAISTGFWRHGAEGPTPGGMIGPPLVEHPQPVPTQTLVQNTPESPIIEPRSAPESAIIERGLTRVTNYTGPNAVIDQELDLLAVRIAQARGGDLDAAEDVFASIGGEADATGDPLTRDRVPE